MTLNIRHWLAERQIELAQLARPGAQIAGIAFRIVQDMEAKSLTAFDISTLAEILELPLGAASLAIEPIAHLSVWLLRILSRKKPLKRNEGTWLTFQVAYLNALQGILKQESHLRRPWLNRTIDFPVQVDFAVGLSAESPEFSEDNEFDARWKFNPLLSQNPKSHNPKSLALNLGDQQLLALLKTLRPGRLSDSQAEQALSLVGESFLVQQMNNTAVAWFVANGAEETEAKLLVQRLTWGLPGYLLSVIAENALPLVQLQKFVRLANFVVPQASPALQTENPFASNTENSSEFSALSAELTENSIVTAQNYVLNLTRENYRAKLLQALSEPLLEETFTLKDLYVPLKGMPVAIGQKPIATAKYATASPLPAKPVDLMEWAIAQLEDLNSIAVIEGEPGCGKSSFCQILAARVAQELYPKWLPVLIRLRDVKLGQTLEQTLDTAFPLGRFTDRDGWLSPNSPPCLLILDGLNELPYSACTERYIQAFLEQLGQFHQRNAASFQGTPRHKLLLSARGSTIKRMETFYGTTLHLEPKLEAISHSSPLVRYPWARIVIQPLEQDEFRQWFQNWSKLQSKSIAQGYFNFLKQTGVFRTAPQLRELATLIRQPLMLYILGLLHRDGLLDDNMLQQLETRNFASLHQLKFEIFARICNWLLAYPEAVGTERSQLVRDGLAHACRSPEAIANLLQNRTPQTLRRQMQIAALEILQSGQHQVPQAVVQARLNPERESRDSALVPALIAGEQERNKEVKEYLNSRSPVTLPAFFFRFFNLEKLGVTSQERRLSDLTSHPIIQNPKFKIQNWIEFSHPKLGEYLCAEEIAQQLKTITQRGQQAYGEVTFAISSPSDVAELLYGLLGYGLLSTEIEDYAIERLRRDAERSPVGFSLTVLFERLYQFYKAYCRGRWLDEGITHRIRAQLGARSNPLNVLQVDAAVGLNVFLLLCAIARVAQIPFWPCGDPQVPGEFDADQLLTLIGRTSVLSPLAFWQRMCHAQSTRMVDGLSQVQLAGACLNQAMLSYANLWQANLSFASLIGTKLSGANLQQANLSWANLAGADLVSANLSGARLEGTDLSGANLLRSNLTLANLTNACLYEAKLDEESKKMASASGAIFSLEEYQLYVSSLRRSRDRERVPENGFTDTNSTLRLIESAEGEPTLPESFQERSTGLESLTQDKQAPLDESDSYYDGETALLENLSSHED